MDAWIAPRLTGGFGNRMFQIMATLKEAENTKRQPAFLLPRTSRCEHGAFDLPFRLFPKFITVETSSSWVEVHEDDCIPPTASHPDATYGIVLKGLYQREAKFPSLSNPFLPVLPSCSKSNNSVAIHFRFGDYLYLPHHQVPLEAYYQQALYQFPSATSFTLFSDQPELLVPFAGILQAKGKAVTISQTTDAYQTLLEIAGCQGGFIGCNSTFGFWASWLTWNSRGRPADYKAVFPETWMQAGQLNHTPSFLNNSFCSFIIVLRL